MEMLTENTVTERKNTLKKPISTLDTAWTWKAWTWSYIIEITQLKYEEKKSVKKTQKTVQVLSDSLIKVYLEFQKERENRRNIGRMAESSKNNKIYQTTVQKAQRFPSRINTKKYTPQHIIFKLLKSQS